MPDKLTPATATDDGVWEQELQKLVQKLSDLSTQTMAVTSLKLTIENTAALTPERLPPFVKQFRYNADERASMRRECANIYGMLCELRHEAAAAHAGKVVQKLIKFLSDNGRAKRGSRRAGAPVQARAPTSLGAVCLGCQVGCRGVQPDHGDGDCPTFGLNEREYWTA